MTPDTAALHVVLVACGAQKLDQPAPARDLYVGDLFTKARAYAERFADRWYVLSAKHHVIHPDAIIAPYDVTLRTMTVDQRKQWAGHVDGDLRCNNARMDGIGLTDDPQTVGLGRHVMQGGRVTVTLLAGADYREYLIPLLRGWAAVHMPLAHQGIGQQKATLLRLVRDLSTAGTHTR